MCVCVFAAVICNGSGPDRKMGQDALKSFGQYKLVIMNKMYSGQYAASFFHDNHVIDIFSGYP